MGFNHINAHNAVELYQEVHRRLRLGARLDYSEKGQVYRLDGVFAATVFNPQERVIFDPVRDANPFFHLMESIWMLAGERDVRWLTQFNQRMANFAEPDNTIWGAYGYRWRNRFGRDQLQYVHETLWENPHSRRAVLAMWHPGDDMNEDKKDYPCNTHIYFGLDHGNRLTMTVCNRSNDAFWGLTGSNIVHMTMLHELMANSLGWSVGEYNIISNNLHAYTGMSRFNEIWDSYPEARDPYRGVFRAEPYYSLCSPGGLHEFLRECKRFVRGKYEGFHNMFFTEVVVPMFNAWSAHKCKDEILAATHLDKMPLDNDWRRAAKEWLERHPSRSAGYPSDLEALQAATAPPPVLGLAQGTVDQLAAMNQPVEEDPIPF